MTDPAVLDDPEFELVLQRSSLGTPGAQMLRVRALLAELVLDDSPQPPIDSADELDAAVAAAGSGDRRATARVLATIRPLVIRYCRGKLHVTEPKNPNADDVAHEICLAVISALPRYDDQGRPFIAFVYGIAAHKIAAIRAPRSTEPTAQPSGREATALADLLRSLPERHREILILRLVVGLSAEETAVAVGSTAGAVRVAQHRAIAKLKAQAADNSERAG